MEARATISGESVSKTFVAAVLVLVAMGLGAMGGYVVKGLGASGASTTVSAPVHPAAGTVLRQDNPAANVARPAAGTVLRQDNPAAGAVELPAYIQFEINRRAPTRLSQDDPAFIQMYAAQQSGTSAVRAIRSSHGDHGSLP